MFLFSIVMKYKLLDGEAKPFFNKMLASFLQTMEPCTKSVFKFALFFVQPRMAASFEKRVSFPFYKVVFK